MSAQDGHPAPGLACLTGGHISITIRDGHHGPVVGWWCLWCGTAAYDGDRIDRDTGTAIAGAGLWQYGPALEITEAPFTRDREDMPR